jgi:hypothetical protein
MLGAIRTVGCQTQNDDGEERLSTANAQNNSRSDHLVVAATDFVVGEGLV